MWEYDYIDSRCRSLLERVDRCSGSMPHGVELDVRAYGYIAVCMRDRRYVQYE